jgi:carboxypeptidase Taq
LSPGGRVERGSSHHDDRHDLENGREVIPTRRDRSQPGTPEPRAGLREHLRRIAALERVARLLRWDQETQMPPRGAGQRADEAAAVAAALHALRTDPRIADWCGALEQSEGADAVDVAEARRLHERALLIPAELAAELARTTSEARVTWEAARAARRFADFQPLLARIVALKRAEAACLARSGAAPYDALLDDFEPGGTADKVAALFAALRPGLVALRERVAASGRSAPRLAGRFPAAAQMRLARRVAGQFGFDWQAGRLDLAAHPSALGALGDVRLTTRIDEDDPRECLFATIHEVGHGLYKQRLDPDRAPLPSGMEASMGVHEAQSRLLENQIGRSRAFAEWLYPAMRAAFGEIDVDGPEALWRAVNAVTAGFIRTEADEVHYDLHILMRFDLERALISGDLEVEDVEPAWNARFAADFGRAVPDAAMGVLQDVHWSEGLFGYFPTYSLGNLYAAALFAGLRQAVPDLDARLAAGDLSPVTTWLAERISRCGRRWTPDVLIERAAGRRPDAATMLEALTSKYGELYELA